jgi:hypothetical protein
MRQIAFAVSILLLTSIAVYAACLGQVKCPIHDVATVTYTGQQKFENNHFFYKYHCDGGGGHDLWVRCD